MEAALRRRVGHRQTTKTAKIPKPKGRVGRDWNLQDRMGLSANRRKYCLVRRDAKKEWLPVLDTDLSISKQDKLILWAVIGSIVKQNPFLAKFKDGWPVYVIIQTQLRSMLDYDRRCAKELAKQEAKSKKKKAHRRDDIESDSESSATEGSDSDTDSLDSESSSSSSDEPVAKSRRCQAAPAQKRSTGSKVDVRKEDVHKEDGPKEDGPKAEGQEYATLKGWSENMGMERSQKRLFKEAEIAPEGSNSPNSGTPISSCRQCSRHVQEIQRSPAGVDDLFASDLEEEPRPVPSPAKKRATRKRAPPDSDEADNESDDDVPLAAPLKIKLPCTSRAPRKTPDDDTMSVDENRDPLASEDEFPGLFTDVDLRALPTKCPIIGCTDTVPTPCPQAIEDLFRNRKHLELLHGAIGRNFKICLEIKAHNSLASIQEEFESHDYPTLPDWADIPRRLANDMFHVEMRGMLEGRVDLERILQFQTLQDAMGRSSFRDLQGPITKFPGAVLDCTGPGYYGDMGRSIVYDSLKAFHRDAVYSPTATATPDIINLAQEAFYLYIAVPYAIHYLIIRDRGVDINDPETGDDLIDCDTIRDQTTRKGILLHPLVDATRDEVSSEVTDYAMRRKDRDLKYEREKAVKRHAIIAAEREAEEAAQVVWGSSSVPHHSLLTLPFILLSSSTFKKDPALALS
ncbi:hypothetical protein FA13DRAFT_1916941 [Coprinellus micaceus]|uniref:Restriction of telomere capping protein 4 n=1 Tax=Coprinellus micaceus TaxID=71717 RepID=A0A4Y7SNC6_COPMI|nr:hypothetical protein FA13DRAFT_1916941 [Coprinellus micaceus]